MSQQKDYFDLVKSIGESKSKQEEDRIISEEVSGYGFCSTSFIHGITIEVYSCILLGCPSEKSSSTATNPEKEIEGNGYSLSLCRNAWSRCLLCLY